MPLRDRLRIALLLFVCWFVSTASLRAGGPRWVTGRPFFTTSGVTPGQSQVSATGVAQTLATAGPLAAGAQALLSGCAWTSVCATFTTQGVDPADLRVVAVSGSAQVVSASGILTPVVLRVTDATFHPVAGAVVEIYQTVDAWQLPCPDRGRCPIPPILASSQHTVTSDADGLVTIATQQLSGVPETTNLAAATGTRGFLSLTLEKQP